MKTAGRQHIEDCENKVELKIEFQLMTLQGDGVHGK